MNNNSETNFDVPFLSLNGIIEELCFLPGVECHTVLKSLLSYRLRPSLSASICPHLETDEKRIGMSTITDIFERIAKRRGWAHAAETSEFDDAEKWEHDPGEETKRREKQVWKDVMKQLHCSFAVVSKAFDEGLEHVGIVLEFTRRPKAKNGSATDLDVEAKGDIMKPGDKRFSEYLETKLAELYSNRGQTLKTWAKGRGLSPEQFDADKSPGTDDFEATPDESHHRRDQQQLYLILYMEFLVCLSSITCILSVTHCVIEHQER